MNVWDWLALDSAWMKEHQAWVWLIIVVPALAPLGGTLTMRMLRLGKTIDETEREAKWRRSFFAPFRDGQLAYVAFGWLAATCFEIVSKFEKIPTNIVHDHRWIGLVDFALFSWLAMICAVGGATYPSQQKPETPDPKKPHPGFFKNYAFGLLSILASLGAAWLLIRVYTVTENLSGS
jgi:hypothetical protein